MAYLAITRVEFRDILNAVIAFVGKVSGSAEVADGVPIGSQLVVLLGLPVLVERAVNDYAQQVLVREWQIE